MADIPIIAIRKRTKDIPRSELERLSKAELIDKVVQLQAYNLQLRNLLQKSLDKDDKTGPDDSSLQDGVSQDKGPPQTVVNSRFDFSRSHRRHILLKILYFGWDYQGYACQEASNATIEHHLFHALTRTCLIESRATSNYHRCGRTDKEVSAFCQVISIDVRSKFAEDKQLTSEAVANEIDYCGLLNRVLPKQIQCIAWMPLRAAVYSARFDCTDRTYRYFFPRGDLDIDVMREACKLLERHTDFRNFCKMDVHNGVTNFVRHVKQANIYLCANEVDDESGYAMHYLEIRANAFLWHQIRCIMAVLMLIGQGKEEPSVVTDLLNIESNPDKPQYNAASGFPLNLYHCEFRNWTVRQESAPVRNDDSETTATMDVLCPAEDDTTSWMYNEENLQKLVENIQGEWALANIRTTMIRSTLYDLERLLASQFGCLPTKAQARILQESTKPRQYKKLLSRKRCEGLENRIAHFVKKQRLVVVPMDVGEAPTETVQGYHDEL